MPHQTKKFSLRHNTTYKRKRKLHFKIQGKILQENNQGWKSIHIWGEPFERGFAHGVLLHKELKRVKKSLSFLVNELIGVKFSKYMAAVKRVIVPIMRTKYPEYYEEICGIHAGAKYRGVQITIEHLVGWNAFVSMYSFFKEGKKGNILRCSAFIATGNATKHGDIIMAHNTHTDFITGQLLNIVIRVTPTPIRRRGHEFVMQTSPGLICSMADWSVSKSGIVCCETTIAAISYAPKFGAPYFCRIRDVMQYARNLDDCVRMMKTDNAGDYACSWFFGDANSGEIMMLELGLKTHNIQRTYDGVFYGMNSAIGHELRSTETTDDGLHDIASRSGNRNYRLNHLLNVQYYGKIDIEVAKKVMGDHYDITLGKNQMNQRTICKHPELDPAAKYKPYSCTDAKIINTKMATQMSFLGMFGSGCGKRDFNKRDYIKKHPEYKAWDEHLEDMPIRKWTML